MKGKPAFEKVTLPYILQVLRSEDVKTIGIEGSELSTHVITW